MAPSNDIVNIAALVWCFNFPKQRGSLSAHSLSEYFHHDIGMSDISRLDCFLQWMHTGSFSNLIQVIDGSARKPALIQDSGYMVEKTYPDMAPYDAL